MERGARTKLIAGLVLAAVFGSGLLLGYAADLGPAPAPAPVATGQADEPTPSAESEQPRQRRPLVYEQLDPTPEQTLVIDSIMQVHRQRYNALDKEYREVRIDYEGRYNALVQQTREAIADVFPPDVAVEYRRLLAEYDRRRAAERDASEDRRN